jgi:hypothetical protein
MPWWLVISCRNRWYLENFVELGAGYGHTSAIACGHFQRVWSVEIVPEVFRAQVEELKRSPNAARLCGPTTDHLATICRAASGPTLWYLDSHYPGMGPKIGPECPLLEELAILRRARDLSRDVVMVDNWGMFERAPRPPHNPAEWPTGPQVADAMRGTGLVAQVVVDVLVASPASLFHVLETP